MAAKLPQSGTGEKLHFATLPDDEDWEDVSFNGKPPSPVPPGDSIGPANVTQTYLYAGDGTASTVIDLRPAPAPETIIAVQEGPPDPAALIPLGSAPESSLRPLETTAGPKTPWDIRKEQWLKNMCDCFRHCCAFCVKDKKKI